MTAAEVENASIRRAFFGEGALPGRLPVLAARLYGRSPTFW